MTFVISDLSRLLGIALSQGNRKAAGLIKRAMQNLLDGISVEDDETRENGGQEHP